MRRSFYGDPSAASPAILPAGYEYLREHGYEVVDGRGFTEEDIIADIGDCDAIIVRTAKITEKILDAAPKLKILARHGAGYDGVDLKAARKHGVLVCTAGGANAISVAELTIFYMLYCSRNFKKVQSLYLETTAKPRWVSPRRSWRARPWAWWVWATSASWWRRRPPWASI